MVLSGSRTAFVALAVCSLVLIVGARRGRGRTPLAALAVMVAVYMRFPGTLGTMISWLSHSFIMAREVDNPAGRVADYATTSVYFWQRPALGMGYGAFDPPGSSSWTTSTSKFLVEIGLLGTVALMWCSSELGDGCSATASEPPEAMSVDLLGYRRA